MADETRLLGAFCVALVAALIATPAAIRVATATGFLDRPVGYKRHPSATPYLGGTAVVVAIVLAVVSFASGFDGLAALLACLVGLLAIGTLDDRVGLPIWPRVGAQATAAAALYAAGLGWEPVDAGAVDLALTVVLFVGVINAYNLMDNLDGAASTVGLVSGLGLGLYAASESAPLLGVVGLAMAGACAGFLPFNLTSPSARIFLGDGGSMPLGFLNAAMIANLPAGDPSLLVAVGAGVVLAGLPAADTALVIVSRSRRGVSLLTGGRDHLTHRLLARLRSPRLVAVVLAVAQACCVAAGILLLEVAG